MPSDQYTRAAARRRRRQADLATRKVASQASVRFARLAPRKARLAADLIRGKQVSEAMRILKFTHRPSAVPIIERLMKSAIANVNQSEHGEAEQLIVGRIWVDSAGMLKRWRPRAYGRASRIRKRLCHISVELAERV